MAASHPIGYVYFIQAPINGYIKIGFCLSYPHLRFKGIQVDSPVPLKRLGFVRGNMAREAELHVQFAHLRRIGEWFEGDPSLLEFIERHAETWPDVPTREDLDRHATPQPPESEWDRHRRETLPPGVLWLTEAESVKLRAEMRAKYGWRGL
jgi:hypothetical protein